ncbi:MAG TPA: ABC transporter substrate-binding protein [Spirochaetia bacterium]|nr:ABC transporter substrate-binding protein [Spirochaetia bacterium]
MRKLLFILTALAVVAGIATATGVQEESGTVAIEVFQSKTVIADQFEALASEFEAANPNISVTVETVGGSADWQTILKSRFAADEGPDVFNIEGVAQYELWQENIADLTGEPFIDAAIESALGPLNVNGRQWGMPVNFEGYGYIYNKDIFEDAGITDVPGSFSELRAAARRLDSAGYTAFGTGYGTWWVIGLHLLNAAFAQQDDPEAFMAGLTNGTQSMAGNEVFEGLQDLIDLTVQYGEDNPLATDHNQQVQLLANGDVAMIQQGVWKETAIYAANPDINIGLIPLAMSDDSSMDRVPVGVPWYFVINAQASPEKQQAGKDFLEFMAISETGQRYAVEEFGYIPAFKGVPTSGLGGVGQDILAYAEADKTVPWVFGQWPDGFAQQDAFQNLQAYVGGQQSWQETLEALDESWQDRAN